MDRLNVMRSFVRLVDCGSFAAAAVDLPSAMSGNHIHFWRHNLASRC